MNIYHQVLIPIFFLLTISIDESVVHSDPLRSTLGAGISESTENLGTNILTNLFYDSSEKSGSKSSSEEHGYIKHHANSDKENGSKSSDENSGSKNSDEKSGIKNSNEESGNKNSIERSGSKNLNKINENKNSKKEKKSENSHEKNECENSHEKNRSENSHEKGVNEFSNEKNRNENSKEKNGNENSEEKNRNENSKENNGNENSKENNGNENSKEKNENENSKEKKRNKDDTNDDKFTLIVVNDDENPDEEYDSGNPILKNLIKNPTVGKEIKSSIPMQYLKTIQAFDKAKIFQYPYHATIVWKPDGRLLCQGALIKPGWIITSAYCIYQYKLHYKTLAVLMGIESLQDPAVISRDILKVIIFPEFVPDQNLNDLALIMLDGDFDVNENLEPVAISKPYNPSERKCQFSSFIGDNLYGKSIEFIFQENCDVLEIEGQILPYFCASINGSLINSSKRSTYGSPLVCGGVIYGVKTKNTLFSSVDTVIPWINDVTQVMTDINNA